MPLTAEAPCDYLRTASTERRILTVLRFKQGDTVITVVGSFISDIRNYPAGTRGTIETYERDVGEDGYIVPGAWVFLRMPDTSLLAYSQSSLLLVVSGEPAKQKSPVE